MSTDVVVYCNGDSFVYGDELGDDLISGHPGYYDYDLIDTEAYRKWLGDSHTPGHKLYIERNDKNHFIRHKNQKLSFPNKIKQLTGFEVINKAVYANTQNRIARQTITDLHQLKKEYSGKIAAIIGTTSIGRIEIPYNINYEDKKNLTYVDAWKNIMLPRPIGHGTNHYEKSVNNLIEFYNHYYTDYHLLVEFYKNISSITNYCKLNDISLFYVTGHTTVEQTLKFDTKNLQDYNTLVEISELNYAVKLDDIARTINKNVMCPGRHFSEIVHQHAAERLVELIQAK